MFQRIGSAAYKPNLNNTIKLCELLDNPQNKFKSVHVAGTNGKGSTSHMLASVLQSAGFKVGLYTSPHLKDFRERIKINGKLISKKFVVEFVEKHKTDFEKFQPSFFEMTVGLAFDYFAQQKVDIAVIEVGLGGRLDSTNVITPLVSVITNISYDHQNLLGDTLQKIAAEKAGIIKPGIPVVIGETQREIKSIFEKKAESGQSEIYFSDEWYQLKNVKHVSKNKKLLLQADLFRKKQVIIKSLICELPGLYQQKNIVTVQMAMDVLNGEGDRISDENIREGIANVITNTGLHGRWQVLSNNPLTIADTGHNEAGIKEVLKQIKLTPHKQLHMVIGMVNDKDISKILRLLPKSAKYYFCKPNIPRGLDESELQKRALEMKLKGDVYKSVKKALKAAQNQAKSKDLVFVGGSTFVVADAL